MLHVPRGRVARWFMRFGMDMRQQHLEWQQVVARARLAEDLGFDGAWALDHFQAMEGEGSGAIFEGMTTIAAVASATTRIRLGLLVAGVTYRHPSVLAYEAMTVDHVSQGRLELGLGAAWMEAEHRALGIDFPSAGQRFDLLEDALEIITRLMTGERVSYSGRRLSLDDARMVPKPVQRPHPPIWIGGSGPRRTIPLVARWADVWHAFGTPESLEPLSQQIDRLAEDAGRDPASIRRASVLSLSEPLDDVRRTTEGWRNAGFEYLVCAWPEEGRGRVEKYAPRLIQEFA